MKKEKILKVLVVLVLGVALISMSTNVFAVLSDADGLTDYYDDKTNSLNSNTNTNTNTENTNTNTNTNTENTNTNLNTNTNTNTNTNLNTNANNYNTNLPKAGAKENTMLGVTVTILAITAVYTYKKVKEYKNI